MGHTYNPSHSRGWGRKTTMSLRLTYATWGIPVQPWLLCKSWENGWVVETHAMQTWGPALKSTALMWKSGKVIGIYIPTLGQEGQRQTDPKNSNRAMPARPAKSVNSILREPVSNKQGREQQRKTTDLTLYPPHTCTHVCMHAYLYTYIWMCPYLCIIQ